MASGKFTEKLPTNVLSSTERIQPEDAAIRMAAIKRLLDERRAAKAAEYAGDLGKLSEPGLKAQALMTGAEKAAEEAKAAESAGAKFSKALGKAKGVIDGEKKAVSAASKGLKGLSGLGLGLGAAAALSSGDIFAAVPGPIGTALQTEALGPEEGSFGHMVESADKSPEMMAKLAALDKMAQGDSAIKELIRQQLAAQEEESDISKKLGLRNYDPTKR